FTPIINPYTSQVILRFTTLKDFLRMSHQERLGLFGRWIDERRLQKLDVILHGALFDNVFEEEYIDEEYIDGEYIDGECAMEDFYN
ncbi:1221_t:CDS:2, partial [Paraglomus occultum]